MSAFRKAPEKLSRQCFYRRFFSSFFFLMTLAASVSWAAQVGIKYNRPKREYPEQVLADFKRFRDDRIRAVMIALPWAAWEPWENTLDEPFIRTKLSAVLQYCYENNIRVILSSHCSFWGKSGDWTIPDWVRAKPSYRSATSALTDPALREAHIAYLKRLVDATRKFPTVEGYNILNEPAAATRWYVEDAKGRAEFDARWEGVFVIADALKKYMKESGVAQFLILGNGNADQGYESFIWNHTGKRDLSPLWSDTLDRISAQGIPALLAAAKWYPDRPSLRTEGALTYAVLQAWHKAGNITEIKSRWLDTSDASAVTFDYDAAYEYEGLANAAVRGLQAFYVWRVGNQEGSSRFVSLLHHRDGDSATPYYSALRDLASGVDSFEALGSPLPQSGKEALSFDAASAAPGLSKDWQGTGTILGQKDQLPPPELVESRSAARVILKPGEEVLRSVIAAHWADNGVSLDDSFVFWARAEKETRLHLTVLLPARKLTREITLKSGDWERCAVPLHDLEIKSEDIPQIQKVGFENPAETEAVFFLDEFLIRSGNL